MNDQGVIGFPWKIAPQNTHKEDGHARTFIIWVLQSWGGQSASGTAAAGGGRGEFFGENCCFACSGRDRFDYLFNGRCSGRCLLGALGSGGQPEATRTRAEAAL